MSKLTAETLVARVERIERENLRLKRTAVLAAVLLAAVVLLAPAKPKAAPPVLKARELQVVDDQGVARISMKLEANGDPQLTIASAKGSEVRLGLAQDRPVLSLSDETRVRALLEVGKDGTNFGLEDKEGIRSVALQAGSVHGVFVEGAESGRGEAFLRMGDSGPSLSLSSPDEAGAPSVELQISPAAGPAVAVSKGSARATLNVSREDDPSVTISDAQGRDRAVLGVTKLEIETKKRGKVIEKRRTDPSSLVLFDPDETVIWKAP